MKQIVCAVLDKKVNAFLTPQMFRAKGEALRSWMELCKDSNTLIHKYPEDFHFVQVAWYDDATGLYTNVENGPELWMSALDALVIENSVN